MTAGVRFFVGCFLYQLVLLFPTDCFLFKSSPSTMLEISCKVLRSNVSKYNVNFDTCSKQRDVSYEIFQYLVGASVCRSIKLFKALVILFLCLVLSFRFIYCREGSITNRNHRFLCFYLFIFRHLFHWFDCFELFCFVCIFFFLIGPIVLFYFLFLPLTSNFFFFLLTFW